MENLHPVKLYFLVCKKMHNPIELTIENDSYE